MTNEQLRTMGRQDAQLFFRVPFARPIRRGNRAYDAGFLTAWRWLAQRQPRTIRRHGP